jgi:exopolyphosphatase / guanosine-5'-triphosphate,3'-diphosphate pyrophosphatase
LSQEQAEEFDRVIAAFDIGSNSIKLSVGRSTDGGSIEEILTQTETVRLGEGIDRTGRLADDRIEAALEALTNMAISARQLGATRLIAVATEATRIAENGPDFTTRVQRTTGIDILTILGDREAELTFLGLDPTIHEKGDVVLVDIGGGSTEVLIVADGTLTFSKSIPLGSGRITDQVSPADPPALDEIMSSKEISATMIADIELPAPIDRLVVLGGTGEFLRPLFAREFPVTVNEVAGALTRLTTVPSKDLAEIIGTNQARARVLPAGVAILLAFADRTNPIEIIGAASGIRRGLLQAAFGGAWR